MNPLTQPAPSLDHLETDLASLQTKALIKRLGITCPQCGDDGWITMFPALGIKMVCICEAWKEDPAVWLEVDFLSWMNATGPNSPIQWHWQTPNGGNP